MNKKIFVTRMIPAIGIDMLREKGFDNTLGTSWVKYTSKNDGKNYTIWYEDERSFKLKYDYVKSQKLRGVSIWALGQEDGNIWKLLK